MQTVFKTILTRSPSNNDLLTGTGPILKQSWSRTDCFLRLYFLLGSNGIDTGNCLSKGRS
ncbi:hypothetical protein T07_3232 [Trichinella nelsoni]|uniref:Uncharacterized protein n=1 Tax=Trichinella nelsoni TaxID=6336 RepID=A0A0V0S871_9BILA|nr:hypothetical protein T07_3232 [Trichinella nelsoni]